VRCNPALYERSLYELGRHIVYLLGRFLSTRFSRRFLQEHDDRPAPASRRPVPGGLRRDRCDWAVAPSRSLACTRAVAGRRGFRRRPRAGSFVSVRSTPDRQSAANRRRAPRARGLGRRFNRDPQRRRQLWSESSGRRDYVAELRPPNRPDRPLLVNCCHPVGHRRLPRRGPIWLAGGRARRILVRPIAAS
jgi:hypothetical protein